MLKIDKKEELYIVIGLSVIVTVAFAFYFISDITLTLSDILGEIPIGVDSAISDKFAGFALLVNFLYEIIPQTFQLLGTGGLVVKYLDAGFSPIMMVIIGATGKLIGQIGLYFAGIVLFRAFAKRKKQFASANHFMHKYHTFVFLLPPFVGALGDIIMVIAGHARLRLSRILPVLYVANMIESAIFVYWNLGQIGLSSWFEA